MSPKIEPLIKAFEYDIPSREDILRVLRAAATPLTATELAQQLEVDANQSEGFQRRLAAMERDGQLMPNRKGVLLLATKLDFIAGRVLGHRDGYGFLIPDAGGVDLWLSPKEMRKVLHGDRVLGKATGNEYRGKPDGVIVEVIERRTNQLVGRLLNQRGVMIVAPEDQRIKHDILIAPGETKQAKPGQVVIVEIIEQPSRYTQPIGRIVDVLGEIDDPGMEIEIAVRKFDVPHVFSAAALTESEQLPHAVQKKDLKDRIDLRDVPLVTIDGEDARDFDDAVYCEPMPGKNQGWRLLVAIADVSHYVQPGSGLDHDALERSTSVYFPRRVIPMLPEKLSNGLCSLNPQVDRLVLVCDMVVNPQGVVTAYQFYNAVMHSAARLSYNQVWEILDFFQNRSERASVEGGRTAGTGVYGVVHEDSEERPTSNHARAVGFERSLLSEPSGAVARSQATLIPHLQHLYEVYKAFAQARSARGAIDLETTETYIVCNAQGKIEKILPRTRHDAHKLIEECMLAANVCAADFMIRKQHPGLFRIHEGPKVEKLANLRTFLNTLGLSLGGGSSPKPSDYAVLSRRIKGRPDAPLLQTMLLRSMQQAIYSPQQGDGTDGAGGHFGLAYEAYAHFTSPIRRYPDLLTHRVIKALLAQQIYVPQIPGSEPASAIQATKSRTSKSSKAAKQHALPVWQQLGVRCSTNERRADDASRDVEAWLKCYFMRERVGEQFRGTITGIAAFGIFVTLDSLFVEGMVHISELGSDYFQFNEAHHELRGERTGQRFRLTDALTIQVARVDMEARKIEFQLVQAANDQTVTRALHPNPKQQVAESKTAKKSPAKNPQAVAQKTKQPASHTRRNKA